MPLGAAFSDSAVRLAFIELMSEASRPMLGSIASQLREATAQLAARPLAPPTPIFGAPTRVPAAPATAAAPIVVKPALSINVQVNVDATLDLTDIDGTVRKLAPLLEASLLQQVERNQTLRVALARAVAEALPTAR